MERAGCLPEGISWDISRNARLGVLLFAICYPWVGITSRERDGYYPVIRYGAGECPSIRKENGKISRYILKHIEPTKTDLKSFIRIL